MPGTECRGELYLSAAMRMVIGQGGFDLEKKRTETLRIGNHFLSVQVRSVWNMGEEGRCALARKKKN